jgi:hypothetical protein
MGTTIAAKPVVSQEDRVHIGLGEMLRWHGEMRDWRRVLVDWRGDSYVISRAAWNTATPHVDGAQVSGHAHVTSSGGQEYSAAISPARRRQRGRKKAIAEKAVQDDDSSSDSIRNLLTAMERGALTMQEVAEALTAMHDEDLRRFGEVLAERQRAPMPTRSIAGGERTIRRRRSA